MNAPDLLPCDLGNAAWHPDPYPFYAALRGRHPGGLFRDATQGWVACSAAAVDAVLAEPLLAVRPPAEPVPAALRGRPAGAVFGALMRMNEGPRHDTPKAAHQPMLSALVARVPEAVRAAVAAGLHPGAMPVDDLMFDGPLVALAALAGIPRPQWLPIARDVRLLVAGWAADADEGALSAADEAAARLLASCGGDPNRVGWFTQACDATAGWIGNGWVDSARRGEPVDAMSLARVGRLDPAVQNTRRWAAGPVLCAGARIEAGERVLVLLASANHDERADGRSFGFGRSRHACPGEALARELATGLTLAWQAGQGPLLAAATARWRYRPSPNARIPRFDAAGWEDFDDEADPSLRSG